MRKLSKTVNINATTNSNIGSVYNTSNARSVCVVIVDFILTIFIAT